MASTSNEAPEKIEVFDNDIAMYLDIFCKEQGIENMRTVPQSVWNAAMIYIKRNVFNDSSILKRNSPLDGYINNNYNEDNNIYKLNNSTCNAYDIDKVNAVCDYYIYICNMYDKGVTIAGFSKLTGIDESTIYDWGDGDSRKLSTAGFNIYKKLHLEYENSLESKLWSNKNPVAHMAIANRRFGWNLPGVSREQAQRPLTAADLPKLGRTSEDESSCKLIEGE